MSLREMLRSSRLLRPVEDLQAPLPVEQLPVQLGQSVVAQVESHQLRQGVENLQQCDRIDKSTDEIMISPDGRGDGWRCRCVRC